MNYGCFEEISLAETVCGISTTGVLKKVRAQSSSQKQHAARNKYTKIRRRRHAEWRLYGMVKTVAKIKDYVVHFPHTRLIKHMNGGGVRGASL